MIHPRKNRKDCPASRRPLRRNLRIAFGMLRMQPCLPESAARALDYASTRHFRKKGVDEIFLTNRIVDNKPLCAAIQVSGVAASIGVAYLFHKTGHHKLERWVSIVHISVGTAGSIRNFNLKPRQPALPSP